MAASSPILLILGSGANIGQHVARAFAAKGYKIALASRGAKEAESTADQLNIACDLSDADSVLGVFSKVKSSLGFPSVVVYNASASTANDAKNPLSLSSTEFNQGLQINTTSAFLAAQQAVSGFEQLPESASKTFIFTGNILNTKTLAPLLVLGVGKTATAHIIESAASAYADRGFKFYYADERRADGAPVYGDRGGEAHAEMYIKLAEGQSQGPWQQTFVHGIGYKSFAG